VALRTPVGSLSLFWVSHKYQKHLQVLNWRARGTHVQKFGNGWLHNSIIGGIFEVHRGYLWGS
jgi:hypothetical protein